MACLLSHARPPALDATVPDHMQLPPGARPWRSSPPSHVLVPLPDSFPPPRPLLHVNSERQPPGPRHLITCHGKHWLLGMLVTLQASSRLEGSDVLRQHLALDLFHGTGKRLRSSWAQLANRSLLTRGGMRVCGGCFHMKKMSLITCIFSPYTCLLRALSLLRIQGEGDPGVCWQPSPGHL